MNKKYEERIGERIKDLIARKRLTPNFRIELEEILNYNRIDRRYNYLFTARIYDSENLIPPVIEDNLHFSEEEEPLSQRSLEIVINYLKDPKTSLFTSNGISISAPTRPQKISTGVYKSEFTITRINRQSSTLD